ncbi:MAG: lysylphosphatidylglycerol synthase transmembrane domain-containing protein [Pseudomonadota bacterium]
MSPDPALIEATGILTAMFVQRLLSTILAVIVSVIVLWWLLSDGAGTALLNAIEGAILWPLALGGLIAVAIQIVRAWRFALLWEGGFGLSSISMIGIATKLVLFNFLLPFKLGELSFPLMMKRAYGTSLGQGAGILILCRLLDLGAVTAIIALAAAWLLDPASHGLSPSLIGIFGLAAFVIPFILVDQLPRLRRAAAKSQRFDHLAGQMSHGAAMMRPFRQRILSAVLTLSIWLAHAVIAWLVAIAVGEAVGFPSNGHGERIQQSRLCPADQRRGRSWPTSGRLGDHAASGRP